jgi:hypothetical protein
MKYRGRIFSQAGNKLGASSSLARNEFLNGFLPYLVTIWERACSQPDYKSSLGFLEKKQEKYFFYDDCRLPALRALKK